MQKGQVTAVVLLLVAGVVGLVVLSSITDTFCNCTPATMEKTLVDSTWVNASCAGTKCATDYSVTCNGTELEVGTEYSIDDCNVRLDNATWNNTVCTLAYTYEGDSYDSGILGTIVCMLPVLIAVGLMVAAVAWVAIA